MYECKCFCMYLCILVYLKRQKVQQIEIHFHWRVNAHFFVGPDVTALICHATARGSTTDGNGAKNELHSFSK